MPKIVIKWIDDVYKKIMNIALVLSDKFNDSSFYNKWMTFIENEYKTMRDEDQEIVISSYIKAANDSISSYINKQTDNNIEYTNINEIEDEFLNTVRTAARNELSVILTKDTSIEDGIDMYFNEVKKEYILMPLGEHEDVPFEPANRDIYIKNNLKLVVSCAKRYRGLGVEFEDLIQAGNIGLIKAFDRYNPTNVKLCDSIVSIINETNNETFTKDEAKNILSQKILYSKGSVDIISKIPNDGFKTKDDFIKWCNNNIKAASFASVAFKWIRGSIMNEIARSRQVNIPYSKLADGYTNLLRIDTNPVDSNNDNSDSILSWTDESFAQDDTINIDKKENAIDATEALNKLLSCLTGDEQHLIKMRFGIGIPTSMSLSQIARQEGLSMRETKKHINSIIEKIRKNTDQKCFLQLKEYFL